MRNFTQVFEEIYQKERWGKGKGSGTGSCPRYSADWLQYLLNSIPDNSVVVDIGCGDHQLYKNFEWPRWKYYGVDVSHTAIQLAKKNSPNANLSVLECTPKNLHQFLLEKAPTHILLKDVMMHWTDDEIHTVLCTILEIKNCTVITANNWRYVRDPSKNGTERKLDRYSWAPIPIEMLEKYGFSVVGFYPKGKFKAIMEKARNHAC